jgi:hypothetical protein
MKMIEKREGADGGRRKSGVGVHSSREKMWASKR